MKLLGVALRMVVAVLAIAMPLIDADGCSTTTATPEDSCCQRDATHPASSPDTDHGCAGCLTSCCHPLVTMPVIASFSAPTPSTAFIAALAAVLPPAGLGSDPFRPPILSA